MCKVIKEVPQHSLAAGVFSAAILFMLTGLGVYSSNTLNSNEHNEGCTGEGPALWAISNFYFSILGGGIGGFYELYLVLIGKIFQVETVPIIPKIRGFNAGYIFSIGLIFDAFMVLGSSNAELLNAIVFALVVVCPLFAPGLAFEGTKQQKIGNIFFGATTVISMLIIFFTGTAYGGEKTKLLLSGSKLLSAAGAILTPPNVSLKNNIQFHILRLIANIMVIMAYLAAHAESSCFPQEAGAQISDKLLQTLGVSVAAGWALHLTIGSKTTDKSKIV